MMIDTHTLYHLGQTRLAQGRYAAAERYLLAALAGSQADHDLIGEGYSRNGLGQLYLQQRRYLDAWAEFWQGLTCHQAADHPPGEADSLTGLGLVWYDRGKIIEAGDLFQEALTLRLILPLILRTNWRVVICLKSGYPYVTSS